MEVAIMYSGGLDSYVANKYAIKKGLKPILIYVDLGHPYSKKEIDSFVDKDVIIIDFKIFDHIKNRLTNQIIPSRNVLLAVIGSMFASRVWINALDGEQNGKERDKSSKFYQKTTELLTYTNNFFQKETFIISPFSSMSKREVIYWALNNGITANELLNTVSCYHGDKKSCGECLTCVKRHIAFALNGVDDGNREKVLQSDYFKELLRDIPIAERNQDYERFNYKRIVEFNKFLEIKTI